MASANARISELGEQLHRAEARCAAMEAQHTDAMSALDDAGQHIAALEAQLAAAHAQAQAHAEEAAAAMDLVHALQHQLAAAGASPSLASAGQMHAFSAVHTPAHSRAPPAPQTNIVPTPHLARDGLSFAAPLHHTAPRFSPPPHAHPHWDGAPEGSGSSLPCSSKSWDSEPRPGLQGHSPAHRTGHTHSQELLDLEAQAAAASQSAAKPPSRPVAFVIPNTPPAHALAGPNELAAWLGHSNTLISPAAREGTSKALRGTPLSVPASSSLGASKCFGPLEPMHCPAPLRRDNHRRMRNALSHVLLAGEANAKRLEQALEALAGVPECMVVAGFSAPDNTSRGTFLGLWAMQSDLTQATRVFGQAGPRRVGGEHIRSLWKFDTANHTFRLLDCSTFALTTDGIGIDASYVAKSGLDAVAAAAAAGSTVLTERQPLQIEHSDWRAPTLQQPDNASSVDSEQQE